MIFGERIKELREGKQLNQKEFAKKIGYSKSVISYWELNRSEPKASAVIAIAKFFGVSADYLLGLED